MQAHLRSPSLQETKNITAAKTAAVALSMTVSPFGSSGHEIVSTARTRSAREVSLRNVMSFLVARWPADRSALAEINFSCEQRIWMSPSTNNPGGLLSRAILTALGLDDHYSPYKISIDDPAGEGK